MSPWKGKAMSPWQPEDQLKERLALLPCDYNHHYGNHSYSIDCITIITILMIKDMIKQMLNISTSWKHCEKISTKNEKKSKHLITILEIRRCATANQLFLLLSKVKRSKPKNAITDYRQGTELTYITGVLFLDPFKSRVVREKCKFTFLYIHHKFPFFTSNKKCNKNVYCRRIHVKMT